MKKKKNKKIKTASVEIIEKAKKRLSINTKMTKAERLLTGEGQVSYAMTLTGVDLIDKQPTKWKVENSWGDKIGKDG
ncbi:C1 family peptidase, partial [Oenococcus oeni]|uniref:C1 family peptidase n=1 Tax=Oenococcus oeni TaxID=1247 RepID=UPI000AB9A4A8